MEKFLDVANSNLKNATEFISGTGRANNVQIEVSPDKESNSNASSAVSTSLNTFQGLRINFSVDSASSGFSFSCPFYPDKPLSNLFKPFGNENVTIKYKGKELLAGKAELITPGYDTNGSFVNVQGRSKTGVFVDSDAGKPYFRKNLTFNQIVKSYSDIVKAEPDTQRFPIVQHEPGTSIYEFFTKIAAGQGLWAIPQRDGSLIYKKILSTDPIQASLGDGSQNVMSIKSSYDVTKLFNTYVAIKSSSGNSAKEFVTEELVREESRGGKFYKPDQENASLKSVAERARSQALIDGIALSIQLAGWEWDDKLWQPGMMIEVHSPLNMIYKKSKFCIKTVELALDDSNGEMTTLALTLPNAFDNSKITNRPWESEESGISLSNTPSRGLT